MTALYLFVGAFLFVIGLVCIVLGPHVPGLLMLGTGLVGLHLGIEGA